MTFVLEWLVVMTTATSDGYDCCRGDELAVTDDHSDYLVVSGRDDDDDDALSVRCCCLCLHFSLRLIKKYKLWELVDN